MEHHMCRTGKLLARRIARLLLQSLSERLALKAITLSLSDDAISVLADLGYSPEYGARPLKRTIQEQLLNPLATRLLNGEFKPGEHIRVGLANDELTFEV